MVSFELTSEEKSGYSITHNNKFLSKYGPTPDWSLSVLDALLFTNLEVAERRAMNLKRNESLADVEVVQVSFKIDYEVRSCP